MTSQARLGKFLFNQNMEQRKKLYKRKTNNLLMQSLNHKINLLLSIYIISNVKLLLNFRFDNPPNNSLFPLALHSNP